LASCCRRPWLGSNDPDPDPDTNTDAYPLLGPENLYTLLYQELPLRAGWHRYRRRVPRPGRQSTGFLPRPRRCKRRPAQTGDDGGASSTDAIWFAYLYLEGGVWNGRQVVPADWIAASVADPYYGYQWRLHCAWVWRSAHRRDPRPRNGSSHHWRFLRHDVATPRGCLHRPAARSPEPLPENPGGLALLEARIDEVKSPRH
jgi:hypothetical protein